MPLDCGKDWRKSVDCGKEWWKSVIAANVKGRGRDSRGGSYGTESPNLPLPLRPTSIEFTKKTIGTLLLPLPLSPHIACNPLLLSLPLPKPMLGATRFPLPMPTNCNIQSLLRFQDETIWV